MSYKIQALPSASTELAEFMKLYGQPFTADVRKWLNALVGAASKGSRLPTIDIYWAIDQVLDPSISPAKLRKDWVYAREQFREAGLLERVRAAMATVRTLKPPWEQHFVKRGFQGLGGDTPIGLEVYFRVIRGRKLVIFDKFEVYTPNGSGFYLAQS